MHEQRSGFEFLQMLNAGLLRLARRMQGIGEQQQPVRLAWFLRHQHGTLTPPIGTTTQKQSAGRPFPEGGQGIL